MCFLCESGLLSLHNLEKEIIHRNQYSSRNNNNSNKEVAKIEIDHLIMSSNEINERLNLATNNKTLRLYFSPGNEPISENHDTQNNIPISRTPEEWQYIYMRENISKISNFIKYLMSADR